QLEFAGDAEISTKHLSFLETGRSRPSRDMVLRLSELLEVPLRERNALLAAAGFAPVFPERKLDDPALVLARQAIDTVLQGHEPYPALAVDRHWNLVASNQMAGAFMRGVDESLLTSPPNVLRVSLHPKGLAPRIANLIEWRTHLLERLRHQVDVSADPQLEALYRELSSFPLPERDASGMTPAQAVIPRHEYESMVVPFKLMTPHGLMSFFSTTTVFGTAVDVTLAELAIEAFFPADAETAKMLQEIAAKRAESPQPLGARR
ncbi:MAG TPA: helix-turn-helix transcriptional regulator, partial [Steroidobacteraceae bacterium]|nr:helix-turn-helix transcriptional regulator [Steroidobacteraceae bacterium]